LDYFAADPQTRVILMYMEGTRDGVGFLDALRRTSRKKPVVILKSGRTPYGREATLSHTASLSGEDRVFDAAFRQAGAIRAENLQEMIEIARVLTTQPPMKGKRVGVLTTSGSMGAMVADAAFGQGMRLPSWKSETVERIKAKAPGWMNIRNPLDIGPSGIFRPACRAVFSDPNPDGFILIPVIPYAAIETWMRLGVKVRDMLGDWPVYRETIPEKPVIAVLLGYKEYIEQIRDLCATAVATVSSPEAAVRALSALHRINPHSQ
jgi:acetyltransferase